MKEELEVVEVLFDYPGLKTQGKRGAIVGTSGTGINTLYGIYIFDLGEVISFSEKQLNRSGEKMDRSEIYPGDTIRVKAED